MKFSSSLFNDEYVFELTGCLLQQLNPAQLATAKKTLENIDCLLARVLLGLFQVRVESDWILECGQKIVDNLLTFWAKGHLCHFHCELIMESVAVKVACL